MWFAGGGTHSNTAQTAVTAGYATLAGDATTLDGIDSSDFVRKTGNQTMAGTLTSPRFIPNTYAEASFPAGNYIGETMTATDTKTTYVWDGSAWDLVSDERYSWTIPNLWQGNWVPVSSNGWWTRLRGGLAIGAGTFTVNTATGGTAGNAVFMYPPTALAYNEGIWGIGYYFDAGNTIYHVIIDPVDTTQFNLVAHQYGNTFGLTPAVTMAQSDQVHIQFVARI
jgi:hypothetical protein